MLCLCAAQLRFWFQTDLGRENSATYYRQGRQLLLTLLTLVTRWSRSTSNFYALISQFMRKIYVGSWILFRGRPFNSWGEEWVISGHQDLFFLTIWWAGYFFPFFSHKLSITFLLHPIFFFRQALAGNFFSKSPTYTQICWQDCCKVNLSNAKKFGLIFVSGLMKPRLSRAIMALKCDRRWLLFFGYEVINSM